MTDNKQGDRRRPAMQLCRAHGPAVMQAMWLLLDGGSGPWARLASVYDKTRSRTSGHKGRCCLRVYGAVQAFGSPLPSEIPASASAQAPLRAPVERRRHFAELSVRSTDEPRRLTRVLPPPECAKCDAAKPQGSLTDRGDSRTLIQFRHCVEEAASLQLALLLSLTGVGDKQSSGQGQVKQHG